MNKTKKKNSLLFSGNYALGKLDPIFDKKPIKSFKLSIRLYILRRQNESSQFGHFYSDPFFIAQPDPIRAKMGLTLKY